MGAFVLSDFFDNASIDSHILSKCQELHNAMTCNDTGCLESRDETDGRDIVAVRVATSKLLVIGYFILFIKEILSIQFSI